MSAVTESPAPSKSALGDSVRWPTGRWALSSAASGQDIQGQEGDDDDRRCDSNDGDGGGGYKYPGIFASSFAGPNNRLSEEGLTTSFRPRDDRGVKHATIAA